MTVLSSDRPSVDPKRDLFGHAPFAEQVAKSIRRNAGEDGLVLALHGPWGSGKTTVLGYVCHFIETSEGADGEKPVIVHFNPWWFSGREDLARAFLHQLQAVLPAKSKKLEGLGTLLGDFAESVGGLIDLTGLTGGAGGTIGRVLGQLTKKKPKDVPALKAEIAKILREARVRVLVIVDDIDRLDESEVRQLFTVIKALADFPYMTYLLAFDREVASQAIERESSLPGERFLEKIIQVPFELPPADKVALRAALFKRLDEVLAGTPDGLFDASYWTNVYHEGIDQFIRVPRDIVRFTNTLSVTYPAVVEEVNPVDFIAIEAIRVFLPGLYDTIRSNQERFAGNTRDEDNEENRRETQVFHDDWTNEIPKEWRASTRDLVKWLFPKIGRMGFGAGSWRRNLRVCHPDLFPIYFRLSLPTGSVSRREMLGLITAVSSSDDFKVRLLRAKEEKRPDGLSKLRALLERLMDHVQEDIPEEQIPSFVAALFDIGDELIDPADERGGFDFGNESRVSRLLYNVLKRLSSDRRAEVLTEAISAGRGLATQRFLIQALDEEVTKSAGSDTTLLRGPDVERLKAAWLERARTFSNDPDFMGRPRLAMVLRAGRRWGGDNEVRAWGDRVIRIDEGLLTLLTGFLQHTQSPTMGERAVRLQPRLNPSWLEPFIDIQVGAERLVRMRDGGSVPEWAMEAVSQFIKEFEMLKEGKNPDAMDAFDDEASE